MKKRKPNNFFFVPLILLFIFCIAGCTPYRIVVHNVSGVNDFKHFPKHTLWPNTSPFNFIPNANNSRDSNKLNLGSKAQNLNEYLRKSNSLAFLIIRNDSILVEIFYNRFTRTDISQVFSISKSITSMLLDVPLMTDL